MNEIAESPVAHRVLRKVPSGISGLDEITGGGLPGGRPILVCGGAGCGKTLMAMEFIVSGAQQFNEPGVFVSFEERTEDIIDNTGELGFDLPGLIAAGKLALDYVHIDRSEIEEAGEYDLEGLFIRLGYAIDTVGAKRVALDTIETLFAGLTNVAILRSELRRLFGWLKDRGVTAIITAERGDGTLTRHGLEEYVSDCVILLDHRVHNQISTRRLRIVKYRGSAHGTNEYPFLIDQQGIAVLPITSLGLEHTVPDSRVSTGLAALDEMLDGGGLFRGSSVLISGTPGTGKTSLGATFADAVCRSGERCLYFAFEESPQQIVRNMRSIGIDLEPAVREGLLRFASSRPTLQGLEMHLALMHRLIQQFDPAAVVIDPMSSLIAAGTESEVHGMLLRLADLLKNRGITALFLTLKPQNDNAALTEGAISSLMDTVILLQDITSGGEYNRGLRILKSRGMGHSNRMREYLIGKTGIELLNVHLGAESGLTGAARLAREARDRTEAQEQQREIQRRQRELNRRRAALESEFAAQRVELEMEMADIRRLIEPEPE